MSLPTIFKKYIKSELQPDSSKLDHIDGTSHLARLASDRVLTIVVLLGSYNVRLPRSSGCNALQTSHSPSPSIPTVSSGPHSDRRPRHETNTPYRGTRSQPSAPTHPPSTIPSPSYSSREPRFAQRPRQEDNKPQRADEGVWSHDRFDEAEPERPHGRLGDRGVNINARPVGCGRRPSRR